MRAIEGERTAVARRAALPPSGPKEILGRYVLLEEIGRGGMACVYRGCFQGIEGFQRTVVVKAMRQSLLNNPEIVEMFRDEAILSAKLTHPNIVRVHDFGVDDGVPYLVMEHLDGWNLERVWTRQRATGRTMPVESAVFIAREIANALSYAHEFKLEDGRRRAVVHRDVSPSNIMLSRDGTVRLLDFGIAKVKGGLAKTTGQVLRGKYGYLAPEQVDFAATDHRVDVFALGVVLYELLTGHHAFKRDNDVETLDRISAARVDPPSRLNPNVSATLDAIVLRALAKDPAQRYATAREMADALTADAAGSSYTLCTHLVRLFSDDPLPAARPTGLPARKRAASNPPLAAPHSQKPAQTAGAKAKTLAMSAATECHVDLALDRDEVATLAAPPPADPALVQAAARRAVRVPRPARVGWFGAIALLDAVALAAALLFCPEPHAQALVARARPPLERALGMARACAAELRVEPLFPLDAQLPPR